MNPPRTAHRTVPVQNGVFHPMPAAESMLTAADIERLVSREIEITPGSVEITRVSPGNLTNTTLFRVLDQNGKTVLGRVEVRIVADETSIRIIPEVRVLGWVQWRAPFEPDRRRLGL